MSSLITVHPDNGKDLNSDDLNSDENIDQHPVPRTFVCFKRTPGLNILPKQKL